MTEKRALNFHIPILVTLLALYPLIPIPYVGPRWAALVAICLFALVVIYKERFFSFNSSYIPLGLFIILIFLSSLFSQYQREAWLGSGGYLTGFFTYLLFAVLYILAYNASLNNSAQTEKVISIWLWSASLIGLLGLLQYFGIDLLAMGNVFFKSVKSGSTIFNSNDLGTYMAMAFPFAVFNFFKKSGYHSILILSLIYGSLLTTLCRSAWVGLAAGFLILILFYPNKKKLLPLLGILFIVTILLLPLNSWMLFRTVGTFTGEAEMTLAGDPEGGSARSLLWQEGLKALPQSPLVGSGPDTFYYVSPEKFAERFGEGARAAHKAHNIYLEIAVTMGIPALLAYLWFLFTILRKTDRKNPTHFAFLMMVVIYLVRGFFLVDVISVYPLFWVLLGFYQGLKVTET